MATAHALAFDDPWSPREIASFLSGPGGFGLAVEGEAGLAGFILCRAIAGEAEVLTLATTPALRRQGVGRALLESAIAAARAAGASAVFLEVAADNVAAIGLYASAAFTQAGVRKGYYRRGPAAMDALVLRRDLSS
jgi:ribosomal-protein-alanine N-acetyltransferase